MPGAVVVAAPGPSLVRADLGRTVGHCDILSITSAFLAVPFATHVYACDRRWWDVYRADVVARHPQAALYGHDDGRPMPEGVTGLRIKDWPQGPLLPGLSSEPGVLHSGRNSGYQALGLAKLLGYSLVLLVGFDMKPVNGRQHFAGGEYRHQLLIRDSPYSEWLPHFRTIQTGPDFRVVNCTPGSALDAFERGALEDFI